MHTQSNYQEGSVILNRSPRIYAGVLVVLFFLSLGLRWYKLPGSMGWWGDVAADHIVSEHIVRHGARPVVGHPATGLSPAFYYPPYFYYVMAGVKAFSIDPVDSAALAAFIQTAAVFPLYGLGAMLAHPLVGFVAAALFIVSTRMVHTAQVTTPPYLLVSLLMFLLWGYVVSYRRRSWKLRQLMHGALVLLSSWFYGLLIFIPLSWLLDVISAKTAKQRFMTTGVFMVSGLLLCASLIWYFGIGRVVGAFIFTHHVQFGLASLLDFWKPLTVTFTDLFFYDQQRSIIAATALSVLGLFSWDGLRRYRRIFTVTGLLMVYYFMFALGLGRLPHDHDVHIIQPILLLWIAGLMVSAWHRQRDTVGKMGVLLASGFFTYLLMQPWVIAKPVANQLGAAKATAAAIVEDSGTMYPEFRVGVVTPGEKTNDHLAFLYWIEQITGNKFMRVVPEGFNLEELAGDTRYYVVCLRYPPESMREQCLRDIAGMYPEHTVVNLVPFPRDDRLIVQITKNGSGLRK